MEETKDLLIRGLTASELEELKRLAGLANTNRTQYVLDLLREHLEDRKPAILGWFKRDRPGEVDDRDEADDPPERCIACGEGIWRGEPVYFALIGGSLVGPYCDECATSG